MNDVIKCVLNRSSIRAYTKQRLTEEELCILKQAALAAPTAMNRNNQRFVFVTNSDIIAEIEAEVVRAVRASGDEEFLDRLMSRQGKVIYNAPLFVGIFSKDSNYAGVDAGIAVENMALTAKSIGLDSVILGMPGLAFNGECGEMLLSRLGVPEGFRFRIGIAIGHRAMEKEPHSWNEDHITVL